MLRKARCEGASISACAACFGLSRVSYYRALRAWEEGGLPALLTEPARAARTPQAPGELVAAGRRCWRTQRWALWDWSTWPGAFRAVHRRHPRPPAPGKKTALTTPRHNGRTVRRRWGTAPTNGSGKRSRPGRLESGRGRPRTLRGVAAWLRAACAPSPPVVVKEHPGGSPPGRRRRPSRCWWT